MNRTQMMQCAAIAAAFGLFTLTSLAQQPAAPAAGGPAPAAGAGAPARGGRGGGGAAAAPAGPVMPLGQRIAVGQLNDSVAALQTAVTAATTALNQAAFANPRNQKLIDQRVKELAAADLALATARATGFQKIQSSPDKLAADQKTTLTGGGGRGGRGGGQLPYNDYTGFTSLFDGKTLNGWDGEEGIFEVIDGAIHMDTAKPGSGGQHHLHYVGPNKIWGNFDLKVEFKQSASGNGGVQYHSRLLSAAHSPDGKARDVYDPKAMADPFGKPLPANIHSVAQATAAGITGGNPWQVSGYQFDIVAPAAGGMGQFYEGQGSRFILTSPGNIVKTFPGGVVAVIGTIQAEGAPNASAQFAKAEDWNQLEIIARGNTFIHMLNGHIVTMTIEDDPYRFAKSGMTSLQCEGGWISYRNVYVRHLP